MSTTRSAASAPPRFAELGPVWQACLEQAREAFRHGSLPIGAVIASAEGEILAVGRNRLAEPHDHAPHLPGTPYLTGSPLAHAEVNALLQMGYERPSPRPILYTTTEPCPLCMGAARMAGVGKVVFAAREVWSGAAGMAESVPYLKRQGPSVEGPVAGLEEPLATWLLASFRERQVGSGPFIDGWREALPRATSVGRRLHAEGRLRELAEEGAEQVWGALLGALGE